MTSKLKASSRVHCLCVFGLAFVLGLAASTDVQAAKILFIINSFVDPVTTANANDQEVYDRLTAQGHTVTLADDGVVSPADTTGIDLVLISSSSSSDAAGVNPLSRNVLKTGRIPVINYEPALNDELSLQTATDYGNAGGHISLAISAANQSHPLAAGKSGTIDIVIAGETSTISSSSSPLSVGQDAIIIATNATPEINVGRIAIWAYEVGARLADNTTINGSRKVAFFYNASTTPGAYNENAQALFDAAVKWALTPPASVPAILVSRTPEPNASAVASDTSIVVVLEDGSTAQVNQSSIKMTVNGAAVTPTIAKAGNRTTITYKPAAPFGSGKGISVELSFADTSTPPKTTTSAWQFSTARMAINLPPLLQDTDGFVVIEAENFDANVAAPDGHQWLFAITPAGFSGDGGMNSLPDSGAAPNLPDALTASPRLDYKVNFVKTGTHYLWFRGSDGGGDSLHAGIDEVDPTGTTLDNIDQDCCGTRAAGGTSWHWVGGIDGTPEGRSTFEVATAGAHTIHLWMREDGQLVDKVLITTDPAFTPTGQGPRESRRVGQAAPPSVSITSPAANASLPAGAPVTITVTATDTDGTIAKVEFFANDTKIGESTQSPFTFTWSTAANGRYVLTAKVTDNSNDFQVSAPVQIVVGTPPPEITFVVGSPPGNNSEAAIIKRLQSFGFVVNAIDDNAPLPADINQKVLILVGSTSGSGNITKYRDVPVPILNWEWAAFDGLGMSDADGQTIDNSETQIEIVNANHPMAAGLSTGVRTLFPAPAAQFAAVDPVPSATVVARAADGSGRAVLFGIEKGAALSEAASPGLKAPARRAGIFLGGDTFATLNADGLKLFDATVSWTMDRPLAQPEAKFGPVVRSGSNLTISWTGSGTLQQADSVTGPWSNASTQSNPQTVPITGTAKFFRIRQ